MTRNIFIAYESDHEKARIPESARNHELYDENSIHGTLRIYSCPIQLVRQYSDHENVRVIRLTDLPDGVCVEDHIKKDPDLNPGGIPPTAIKAMIKTALACLSAGVAWLLKILLE